MATYVYGPPNPKTLIPPIIPPPLADFESWRTSSQTPNNYINSTSPLFYAERSGYESSIPDLVPQSTLDNINTLAPAHVLSNINPYYVQALSGPNSWTVNLPKSVNHNIGISKT